LTGVIDYHVTETLRNQTIGLDAVSLIVVAPLALFAAWLVFRDHVAGFALALGIGAYSSYMLLQYIVGPDYAHLPGNNERLFPAYLLLFVLGWAVVLGAWSTVADDRLALPRTGARLLGRWVLPVLVLVLLVRYVESLSDWMSGSPADGGYLAGPNFAWAIAMLDLGIFLPATVIACAGVVRGRRWAMRALYLVLGWFGLVGPAVAAMALTMYVNDDPNASGGNVVFMCVLGIIFAGLAVWAYVPLFGARAEGPR
jgi:hypothetical protein